MLVLENLRADYEKTCLSITTSPCQNGNRPVADFRTLSQRDYRTQPGVNPWCRLIKMPRPKRGGRTGASGWPNGPSITYIFRPFPPSSHIPGTTVDRQGGCYVDTFLGLKPQAESCSPFGTKSDCPLYGTGPTPLNTNRRPSVQVISEKRTYVGCALGLGSNEPPVSLV